MSITIIAVCLIAALAIFFAVRGTQTRVRLPRLAPWGALPVVDLPKYFRLAPDDPAIAWEAVRGWDLNERPADWSAPPKITHAILTPRLLDFCSLSDDFLHLHFNFLIDAIKDVAFDLATLPPGFAPQGTGLLTIHTPSGETLLVCSAAFANALKAAMARA